MADEIAIELHQNLIESPVEEDSTRTTYGMSCRTSAHRVPHRSALPELQMLLLLLLLLLI